jgi:hypothetical protein
VPVWFCKSPLPWPEENDGKLAVPFALAERCLGGPDVERAGLNRLRCPKRRLQLAKKGEKVLNFCL